MLAAGHHSHNNYPISRDAPSPSSVPRGSLPPRRGRPEIYMMSPDLRMLAFIMPQEVRGTEAPRQFLTSIDKMEEQTGLDFFTGLQKDQEARLEADVAPGVW